MHKDIQEILYADTEIKARVAEIGAALTDQYSEVADRGEGVLLLSVLRGAAIFMADLARATEIPLEMDYMALSSYGSGAKSSGNVKVVKGLTSDIRGKHVVVVEDILDSGLTLQFLLEYLKQYEPASVEIITLLRKRTKAQVDIECAHVGFECPDEFIVGYGLDYAERYRNLPYIGILKPEVYE
ncbi:MAG TPA: hypoxanthine phosphoribosyltransferase [Eggerthellaceae bacterium]|nr:hypoxanthine phosphoribosyltransferase [Eggerthellaceae bacterium]